MSTTRATTTLPTFSLDGPGGNSPLDWRGHSGLAMTRLASWLVWKADRLQKQAYVVTRGEIDPTLPILFNQLGVLADSMGTRPSELVGQIEAHHSDRLTEGRFRTVVQR